MSTLERERKTYRGATLEELLPQIRAELGADAVITRRREGVVGGIGGFFGKKCVEVEVEGTAGGDDDEITLTQIAPVLPPRFAVNAYDTGPVDRDAAVSPLLRELRDQAAPFLLDDEPGPEEPVTDQDPDRDPGPDHEPDPDPEPSLPSFAERLAAAQAEEEEREPVAEAAPFVPQWLPAEPAPAVATPAEPEPDAPAGWPEELAWLSPYGATSAPPPPRPALPAPEPEPEFDLYAELGIERAPLPAVRRATLPEPSAEADVRFALAGAALADATVASILREVEQHVRPFDPAGDLRAQVRCVLARRLKTRAGWRGKRRTIAVIGPPRAGRTLTAARLCHAYAGHAGLSVGAVSLEAVRSAIRLGGLVEPLPVELGVAETAGEVASARGRLHDLDLVVADTPALTEDAKGLDRLARLLTALRPDEVHLVVPATLPAAAVERLLELAARVAKVDAMVVSRLDEAARAPQALGVALAARLPISFLASGERPELGLAPAEPHSLAELVL